LIKLFRQFMLMVGSLLT